MKLIASCTHTHIIGAERAATRTTITLMSTQNNNNIIKSTESPWIRPSASTSSWIRPSTSPSPMPELRRSSDYLIGVCIAIVALSVAAGAGLAALVGIIRCRRYRQQIVNHRKSPNGMHDIYVHTPPAPFFPIPLPLLDCAACKDACIQCFLCIL